MNITVNIVSPELAQALENLAAAIANRAGPFEPVKTAETAEPEKPKGSARSAAKKADTPPTSASETASDDGEKGTAEKEPVPSSNDGGSDIDGGVDYSVVKKAVMDLALAKGRGAVVDLLTEFDVPDGKKADSIPAERWQAFIDRAAEIMG